MTRVNEEIRYTSDCDHSACRYAIFKSIENDFDEDEDFDLSKQNQELEIANGTIRYTMDELLSAYDKVEADEFRDDMTERIMEQVEDFISKNPDELSDEEKDEIKECIAHIVFDIFIYCNYYFYSYDELKQIGDYNYMREGNSWHVTAIDKDKEEYGEILDFVDGMPVTSMEECFEECRNMKYSPIVPSTIKNLNRGYVYCDSLRKPPLIPDSVESAEDIFFGCDMLEEEPKFPPNVILE